MNSPFLILVGLLACAVRFHIADSSEENVLAIMAMINTVAFDYIILVLTQDARHLVIDQLENNRSAGEMRKKSMRKLNIGYTLFYFFAFAVLGFVYVYYFYSSKWNDAISIMALVISISSERISKNLGNVIYKIL